ncbi:hypothetical protein [Cohnella luojiensis]|uniref:Uncharacterized protein n=1 Tax=Cohnella luojiensis TaxID=652876 RepID=A0A4Y8M2R9_9BACL|nr:hypothetical protein [Cohnella luojiensis]TFE26975.1 hypothetical protein E2980_10800 [Cohnella luojiensis]
MKAGIGYLYVGALAFCIIMLCKDGIALAQLPGLSTEKEADGNGQQGGSSRFDLIAGITSLTEEVSGNLVEVIRTAGNKLEQTVEMRVETPVNLASGAAELLYADKVLLSVDEAISSTVQILPEPLASAVEVTVCALKPCLQTEAPRLPEVPTTHGEPQPGGKIDGHAAPDAGLEQKPDLGGAEAVREDNLEPREAPVNKMEQEEGRATDVIVAVHPKPAQVPIWTANDDPSPWCNNANPNAVPGVGMNTQTQSGTGHGGYHYPKLFDAIAADITSMQNSGRRIYARNTRQLITKRGNEPPTPPPRNSFFSYKPMRKRSVSLVKKNRRVALFDAGSGSAIWDHRSPCY